MSLRADMLDLAEACEPVEAALGQMLSLAKGRPNYRAATWAGSHAGAEITEVSATVRGAVRDMVEAALEEGWRTAELAEELQGLGFETERAEVIAAHELRTARNAGRLARWEEEEGETARARKVWVSSADPCPICTHLAGQTQFLDEPFDSDLGPVDHPPAHVGCVAPDVAIGAVGLTRGYRARYRGYLVELRLPHARLAVSPNHPVLTPQGWVAADRLHEGDYVISGLDGQRVASAFGPDVELRPAEAAEVFDTLRKADPVLGVPVPRAPEQFHGDGRFLHGEVEVVTANGLLQGAGHSTRGEPGGQHPFIGGRLGLRTLQRAGHPATLLERLRAPALRDVRGQSVRDAFGVGHPRHPKSHGLREATRDDGGPAKPHAKGAPADPQLTRERVLRLAGGVAVQCLGKSRRVWYAGHVYDFQAAGSVYLAEGVLVHNCVCSMRLVPA